MAINVSQAFKRTSIAPIDETIALTKAQMLTVSDTLMPAYYFTICQDDGKIYLYDKTATPSASTGKFTEFSGGGGSGSGHTIVDTDGTPVADEPKLQFTGLDVSDNSTDSETEVAAFGLNADSLDDVITSANVPSNPMVTNGLVYSTTEQIVGRWIDGKPIYQKTIQTTVPTPSGGSPGTSYISIGASVGKLISYHGMLATNDGIDVPFGIFSYADGLNIYVYENTATDTQHRNTVMFMNGNSAWAGLGAYITVQYTKTTD